MNRTEEAVLTASRGERAASCRHYRDCAECRAWVAALPPVTVPRTVEGITHALLRIAQANRLVRDDLADPEFRAAAGV